MDTQTTIRDYIVKELIRNPKYKLGFQDKLISGGIISSFDLVQLAMFLEDTFGLSDLTTEMTAEYVDSVEMMAQYIDAHRK